MRRNRYTKQPNIPNKPNIKPKDISAEIELKTKYYVDQRINILQNSNDLLTRGANEISIEPDMFNAGCSFMFKYNGDAVARITDTGVLYCRNLWINGINLISAINNILQTESSTAQVLSEYVKHIELKDGTYELNVSDTVSNIIESNTSLVNNDLTVNGTSYLKILRVNPDENNTLEYPSREYNNRSLFISGSGTRNIGYSFFVPLISDRTYIHALQVGKDLRTGNWGGIGWYHYGDNNANNFITMSALDGYSTLRCKKDGTVYIRSPGTNTTPLTIKYEGNLSNSNYQRISIGDNRDLATFAYGRENSSNYAYMKVNGRNCELRVYDTYMNVNGSGGHYIRSSRTSGAIAYFLEASLANDSTCALVYGQAIAANSSGSLTYRRATVPKIGLGFYNNDELFTLDPSGNCSIRNSLTAGNAILASTSVTDLYSTGNITTDSTIDCHKLNITDININTDYVHITAFNQTLTNGDYIRCRLSDSTGDATIDLTHDTQYYGLKLQVPTDNNDDNKLVIWPTGVTIDGSLDCYDDVSVWEDMIVDKTLTVNTSISTPAILVNGHNVITDDRLWTSGNNYDVIPYTTAAGVTNCGSTINFWSSDTATSNPKTIEYNGYRFEHNSPIGVTSSSSTLAQFYVSGLNFEAYMKLGKDSSNSLHTIYYVGSSVTNSHCTMGLASYPALDIYYNKVDVAYPLSCPSITASAINASNVYASNSLTVDGTILCAVSDIADVTDNKDYLKLRYDGTLADTHYIRLHMKDTAGNGYIDLYNNSGTYEIKISCGAGQMSISDDGLKTDDITTNTLSLAGYDVNGICDSTDVSNQSNIDDDHLITASGANMMKPNYTVTPPSPITNLTFGRSYVNWLAVIPAEIKAIAYGHGIYVALLDDSSSSYCYSSDGITWNHGYFSSSGDRRCICYGADKFICPRFNTSTLDWSYDGINWNTATLSSSRNWSACAYGNGIYLCLSNSSIWIYSTDGILWNDFNTGVPAASYNWTSCCYGNGIWVATINNSGRIAYSTSGTSGWTLVNTNATYSTNWQSCAYGNGIWIAVSYIIDEYPSYIISSDGINWTEGSSNYSLDFASITYGNGWFVASSTWGELEWTQDGIQWYGTSYGSPNCFNSICAGPDKIVTLTTGKHLSGDLYIMEPYATYTTTNFHPQPTYSTDLDNLSQMIIGRIYPIGAIYTSTSPVSPFVLFGFGTWEQITDKFLYCTPGPSESTGGYRTHVHTLSDDGYTKIATHGGGNIVIREKSTPSWTPTHKMSTGPYDSVPSSDSYGQCLGGSTDSFSSLPPYISVYAWKRTA